MRLAGFLFGVTLHHLDHIAPFCAYLDIPLIVTEKEVEELALSLYPSLVVEYKSLEDMGPFIFSRYDCLVSTHPRFYLDSLFFVFEMHYSKKMPSIFLPHGNSDKGHQSELIEAVEHESYVGIYGKKMRDFLDEKGVISPQTIVVGNYRRALYEKCKPYFDTVFLKQFPLTGQKPTYLYAPTWNDGEKSSSFFLATETLLRKKPNNVALLIKPHPNTLKTHRHEIDDLKNEIQERSDIHLIEDFPLIYPILAASSVYIGDMSSIGYDFLSFERPMFFLNPNNRDQATDKGLYLTRCGTLIERSSFDTIYDTINANLQKNELQRETYSYTFEVAPEPQTLLQSIRTVCKR